MIQTDAHTPADALTREQLLACVTVSQAITAALDPEELLGTIMETVSRLLPAETWSLLAFDAASDTLAFRLSIGISLDHVAEIRLPLDGSVAGQAVRQGERVVVTDVADCPYFFSDVDVATGHRTRSIISVPIRFSGRTLGVLEVVNPKTPDGAGLALLDLLAEYLAIAMENARRYQAMEEMANRDHLTGFYNQRYLYRELNRWGEACLSAGQSLAMIFLDMDDFKKVVDAHGHPEGSRVLRDVARVIASRLPDSAYPVAYAGDEFIVVMPDCSRDTAIAMAESLRDAIASANIPAPDNSRLDLSASFGVAAIPHDADSTADLLALADQAMFSAKKSGKGCVGGVSEPSA